MKISTVIAAFCLAVPMVAQAAPGLSVAYLEGQASVKSGTTWTAISIGAAIPTDASVRLDAGAYVLLKTPGADIILTQKGTYSIRSLLTMQQSLRTAGAGKALSSSLSYILGGGVKNQSSALGARGADKAKSDDSEWAESSAGVFLDSGKTYLQSGQYDKAVEQLLQALDAATDDEEPEIRYYLASAYSLKGDTREALKQAGQLQPGGGSSWSADFVILKAKLLADTNGFAEEVQWLKGNGSDLSQDAQRAPVYFFLLGLGYRGIGDLENEKSSLGKVVAMAKDSDLGSAASQLLQNP
jgi:tetratricopeptide (TPR) repeat protein